MTSIFKLTAGLSGGSLCWYTLPGVRSQAVGSDDATETDAAQVSTFSVE